MARTEKRRRTERLPEQISVAAPGGFFLDGFGTPSFQTLQRRMHVVSPHDVRLRMSDTPSARAGYGSVRLGTATTVRLGTATMVFRPTSHRTSKANLLPARQRSRLGV